MSFIVVLHFGPALFASAVLFCSAYQFAMCQCKLVPKAGSPVIAHSFVVLVTAPDKRAMHFVLACVEQSEDTA